MDDILFTRALRDQGFSYDEVLRMRRRGELEPIRRGAYAIPGEGDLGREALHRRLIQATVPQLVDGSVVSHHSAAVLHGLPVWLTATTQVHVTRLGDGQVRKLLHVNPAPLREEEIVVVDGIALTSVARTVLDLARTRSMEQAVAAADWALRAGLPPELLTEGLSQMRRWRESAPPGGWSRSLMPGARASASR
jgi:predicted transcriptional regulator of viral defense system